MKNMLNNLVAKQKIEREYILTKGNIVRAEYEAVKDALNHQLVKVITGPRRAGKSMLALQVLDGTSFAYLNLEDNALPPNLNADELFEALVYVYGKVDYFLFDEIQSMPRWEQWINKLHRRGSNIIITGSNSKLLSKELGASLTGRYQQFELFPFSYAEFVNVPQYLRTPPTDSSSALDKHLFEKYLLVGGFPEVVISQLNYRDYLKTLLDSIVLNDVISRYKIRNPIQIYSLVTLLINSVASKFSAHSLTRALDNTISVATIQKYLKYLNDAYICQDLHRYFDKTKNRLKADRKIYIVDNGFVTSSSSGASPNKSKLLENLVFIELRRRGMRPNIDLFYYVTKSGYEVDFVTRSAGKTLALYQVSTSLETQKTLDRELRSLVQAGDELSCSELTILILNGEARTFKVDGKTINVIPTDQWCLSKI